MHRLDQDCAPSGAFHRLPYMVGQHWFSHYLIWCWWRSITPCGRQFGDRFHQLALVHLCWGRSLEIGSQLVIWLIGCNQADWGYDISLLSTIPQSHFAITADTYLITLNPWLTISTDQSAIKLDSCTLFNTKDLPVPLGHWQPWNIQALMKLPQFCTILCCR